MPFALSFHFFILGWRTTIAVFYFVQLLGHHASHGNDADRLDTAPDRIGDGKAGATGPSGFAAALLRTGAVGGAQAETTGATPGAHATHATIMHDLLKKVDALFLSNFGGILSEAVFFSHEAARHIVGTADTVVATQARHFEAQEGVGTILFAVRAGLNCKGCTGTTPGQTLRSIMIALPELVARHVTAQCLVAGPPLRARWKGGGQATIQGFLTRRGHHGHAPTSARSLRLVCVFGIGAPTKDQRKRERTPHDPNGIGKVFHTWISSLEAIGANAEGPVQTTPVLPTLATRGIDATASQIHGGNSYVRVFQKKNESKKTDR